MGQQTLVLRQPIRSLDHLEYQQDLDLSRSSPRSIRSIVGIPTYSFSCCCIQTCDQLSSPVVSTNTDKKGHGNRQNQPTRDSTGTPCALPCSCACVCVCVLCACLSLPSSCLLAAPAAARRGGVHNKFVQQSRGNNGGGGCFRCVGPAGPTRCPLRLKCRFRSRSSN